MYISNICTCIKLSIEEIHNSEVWLVIDFVVFNCECCNCFLSYDIVSAEYFATCAVQGFCLRTSTLISIKIWILFIDCCIFHPCCFYVFNLYSRPALDIWIHCLTFTYRFESCDFLECSRMCIKPIKCQIKKPCQCLLITLVPR